MILICKLFIFSLLSYHIYPIYRILFFVRKLVYGSLRPPSVVNHFALSCGYPSCVEVIVGVLALSLIPLMRGDCGGMFECVSIPLSLEVIVRVLALSLIPPV